LKLVLAAAPTAEDEVAPRMGAWIETAVRKKHCGGKKVAPRMGAWIETQGDCSG